MIAQNSDPKKEEISFAQSYFAVQTRKQELIEERISLIERTEARSRLRESEKRLSPNIYERGVEELQKQKAPTNLIVCGRHVDEMDIYDNVHYYPSFSQRWKERAV